MTDLSIIIVSYKGWEPLTKCLESLTRFTSGNFTCEVIVVDNKSDDDTLLKIEEQFSDFRFIHNMINGGFANGCNLGSKIANGAFFLFLNPDTVVSESELDKLLSTAKQNPSFSILSCKQVNENGKESIASGPFPRFNNLTGFQRSLFGGRMTNVSSLRPQASDRTPEISYPDWISGSVILMRRETFQQLGGFDEDFWMYFEDVDLCRRARDLNFEIAFCRNITIEHNHGGSSRINIRTASMTKTEVHISRHNYISKHKKGINKVLIQSFLVINNLISGGIMALLGLLFFFVPKVFVRTMVYIRLLKYYFGSILRVSWISPRSVNFHLHQTI